MKARAVDVKMEAGIWVDVPGSNTVVDMVAAKVVQRSHIPLLVIDGRDPRLLEDALFSGREIGTIVTGDIKSPLPLKKAPSP